MKNMFFKAFSGSTMLGLLMIENIHGYSEKTKRQHFLA